MSDNEKSVAEQCAAVLNEKDAVAANNGLVVKALGPGRAEVTMEVTKAALNGFGICHGGMIFVLADTAFAHASNSENVLSVAMDCRIDFLRSAQLGDVLTATAEPQHVGRSSGLYTATVKDQNGLKVALFQGRSFSLNKPVLGEAKAE